MTSIDCTPLTIDDATLAHLLSLASRPPWTHAPLALRVTDAQMAALDVEVIGGVAYLGDVPVTTGDTQPPPRPRAPVVVEPVVVDLDEAKAARIEANSAELLAHVESRIDKDEMNALIATRLRVLGMRADGVTPNAEAVALLDGMQAWVDGCMMMSALLSSTVEMASTVEEVGAIAPDLAALPAPAIVSAGALTFMLYAGGL